MDEIDIGDDVESFALQMIDDVSIKDKTLILDPEKDRVVESIYSGMKNLLDKSHTDYTIDVKMVMPYQTSIEITILTDMLSAVLEDMKVYKDIVNKTDEYHTNIFDGKLVIKMYVSNVFINAQ